MRAGKKPKLRLVIQIPNASTEGPDNSCPSAVARYAEIGIEGFFFVR